MTSLPSYADLPVTSGAPRGSSWGVWGDDDKFGCLNLLTPAEALAGSKCVRSGTVFPLNLELELPDPPLFGRPAFGHEIVQRPSGVSADDMLHGWNTQSSSQWDGFRHVRSAAHGAYNGLSEADHGVHFWARKGIVGRGLIVDVARWRASVGRPIQPNSTEAITPDDIDQTLRAQNSSVQTGDILLVRSGWLSWYRSLDHAGRASYANDVVATGLEASETMAAYLWDLHISCIGMDNPAIEVWPPPMATLAPEERAAQFAASANPAVAGGLFLHLLLLPLLGLPLGELFDLDALCDHATSTHHYDVMITSSPLNLLNGVATPPNILAIA